MWWLLYSIFVALLAPFQAGWAIALSYFGFTQVGIAGGSVAATMMSSTAIASGGAVSTGSIVAYLQALGATAVFPSITSLASGTAIYAVAGYGYARRFFGYC